LDVPIANAARIRASTTNETRNPIAIHPYIVMPSKGVHHSCSALICRSPLELSGGVVRIAKLNSRSPGSKRRKTASTGNRLWSNHHLTRSQMLKPVTFIEQ